MTWIITGVVLLAVLIAGAEWLTYPTLKEDHDA